jgi:hypothetical protein
VPDRADVDSSDPRDTTAEPLYAPKLHGFPFRGVVQALACGSAVVWASRAFALDAKTGAVAWALVTFGSAYGFAWKPGIDAASTRLVFDEGGIRLLRRSTASYHPFARGTRAVFFDGGLTSPSRLDIEGADGAVELSATVLARLGKYDAEDLVRRYNLRARDLRTELPATTVPLEREGRDVDAWCAEIAAAAKRLRESGYREGAIRDDLVTEVFRDRRFPPEPRAAAAHFLLALESPEARKIVAERLGPGSPPLVLALANRAPFGREVVRAEDLAAASPYLSDPRA